MELKELLELLRANHVVSYSDKEVQLEFSAKPPATQPEEEYEIMVEWPEAAAEN